MGRGIFTKQNNQWCSVKNIWTKHNGVWCPVKKVYTKVNGQWCLCFLSGSCDYTLTQFEWESTDYARYSAGIDATKDGCFLLHQHSYVNYDTYEMELNIEIFDTDGNFVKKAISVNSSSIWPQCVKKIGDKIWFSYTGSESDGFYTIPWDETLQIYPVSSPTAEIPNIPYNWKVTQRKIDRKIFFCAAGTFSSGSHSIFYYDKINGSVTKVVEVGGSSCGFDFDNEGNLWSGEYLLSYDNGMHILPCRLGMWTKEDIDSGVTLTWANASVTIDLGSHPDTGFNWGVSDVVCDDKGNVYVSVNTYEQFDMNYEYGAIIKVYKDEEGNYQKEYLLLRDNTDNNNWDWFRSMTIDGDTLILDIDHNQMDPSSPDACQLIQI